MKTTVHHLLVAPSQDIYIASRPKESLTFPTFPETTKKILNFHSSRLVNKTGEKISRLRIKRQPGEKIAKKEKVMALVLVHGNTGQFHSFNNEAEQTIQMEINGRLKRLNNAYLTHNRAIVRDSMTSDHVTITPIVYLGSAAEVLESMENYQIREYQTEDEEFRILSPVTVLVNYKAHIHGHFGSKDISGDFRVSALWCRQNGFWKEACYQETKIGN